MLYDSKSLRIENFEDLRDEIAQIFSNILELGPQRNAYFSSCVR